MISSEIKSPPRARKWVLLETQTHIPSTLTLSLPFRHSKHVGYPLLWWMHLLQSIEYIEQGLHLNDGKYASSRQQLLSSLHSQTYPKPRDPLKDKQDTHSSSISFLLVSIQLWQLVIRLIPSWHSAQISVPWHVLQWESLQSKQIPFILYWSLRQVQ